MEKLIKRNKKYITSEWKDAILEAVNSSNNMTEAYRKLGLRRDIFKRMAEELGVYKPNQGRKGSKLKKPNFEYNIQLILQNKLPCQSHKLKLKLIKYGYKQHKCESCNNSKWKGQDIPLELHHKNGDNSDNSLENLELLCPNCHALTKTYRSKKLLLNKK